MSKITCSSLEQFISICCQLVREGVGFRADADALVIVFTGGF